MAIINIRGTSGSGKTTLVNRIIDCYKNKSPIHIERRKRPIAYTMEHPHGGRPLAVIGHYETPCGGCDTISDVRDAFGWVELMAFEGYDVLFEGLLIAADVNRTVAIHEKGYDIHVLALNTPLDLCLESVNMRRRAKDPTKPDVNPHNTSSKFRGVLSSIKRLRAVEGFSVQEVDREEAWDSADHLLGLTSPHNPINSSICQECEGMSVVFGDGEEIPCPSCNNPDLELL